jgi:hypothetical protein
LVSSSTGGELFKFMQQQGLSLHPTVGASDMAMNSKQSCVPHTLSERNDLPYNHNSHVVACIVAFSDSEFISATTHFGRSPWKGDRSIAKPVPTQDRTEQHRKTRTRTHSSSGIRTHDPKV